MFEQLKLEITALWREVKPRLFRWWLDVLVLLRAVWGALRPLVIGVLQVIAALIVLFEEWGYRPLAELLGKLARFRLWARLELWIAGLPPYGALAVFALPTTILLPLKFVALWLLANGFLFGAGALFVGAKIASTALIARIFMLTKPGLMQIGWFARTYNWFMPWKEAIFTQIRTSWIWRYGRMVKSRIKLEAKKAWQGWRPRLQKLSAEWRPLLQAFLVRARLKIRDVWSEAQSHLKANAVSLRTWARRTWIRISGA